jgi:hypothetical protein
MIGGNMSEQIENLTEFTQNQENKTDEIIFLKKTIKAFALMTIIYRMGEQNLPEWVNNRINEAKNKYGDLYEII